MLRAIVIVFGIVLAAVGGVIAYRAFFLEPAAAVIISERGVRELPDTLRVVEGIVLLIVGAAIAFIAAVRKSRRLKKDPGLL
jgi:chloramphenicol 3-O-phosphotransferase